MEAGQSISETETELEKESVQERTEQEEEELKMKIQAGDIILYQGRTFVIYYDTNSWSLTPIGKIEDVNAEELKKCNRGGRRK